MNIYLEKIAKLNKIVAPARKYILGGTDELSAMRNTRAEAMKALKVVKDEKTKARLKDAYKAIYKHNFDPVKGAFAWEHK